MPKTLNLAKNPQNHDPHVLLRCDTDNNDFHSMANFYIYIYSCDSFIVRPQIHTHTLNIIDSYQT